MTVTAVELHMIPHYAVSCSLFHLKFLNLNLWVFFFPLAGQTFCFLNISTSYKGGSSFYFCGWTRTQVAFDGCVVYSSPMVYSFTRILTVACVLLCSLQGDAYTAFLKLLFGKRITGREQPTHFLFKMCWKKSSTCWAAPLFVLFKVDDSRGKRTCQTTCWVPYSSQCRLPLILGFVSQVVSWMVILITCSDMYCWLPLISSDSSMAVSCTSPLTQTHALTCHWGTAYQYRKFWLIKVHIATETLLFSKLFIIPLGQLTFLYFSSCFLFHV